MVSYSFPKAQVVSCCWLDLTFSPHPPASVIPSTLERWLSMLYHNWLCLLGGFKCQKLQLNLNSIHLVQLYFFWRCKDSRKLSPASSSQENSFLLLPISGRWLACISYRLSYRVLWYSFTAGRLLSFLWLKMTNRWGLSWAMAYLSSWLPDQLMMGWFKEVVASVEK